MNLHYRISMLLCMFTGVFLVKLVTKIMAKYGAKTGSCQVNGGQRPSMHALLMLGAAVPLIRVSLTREVSGASG